MTSSDFDDDSALPDELRNARYSAADIYDAPGWYDVDYAGYRGEEAFYKLVVEKHARAGGVVVELGAGTGRLAIPFAERGRREGWRVHGVEPAPAMRDILLRKRALAGVGDDALAVEDGVARSFVGPGGRIDVVMFPFNGLLHVRSRDEMIESFRHVHQKLDDGGRFALDFTGPYWDAILFGPMSWGRADERVHHQNGRKVLTCDRSSYDPKTRQMRIDIRYLMQGEADGAEIALHQVMWTWQQVLSALDAAGFVVDLLFGDVDMAPFDEGSTRFLASCAKR